MNKQTSYLMIDHRASPGIPETTARAMGLDPKLVGEGKLLEADLMHCAHCNQPMMKNPLRTRERYSCMGCSGDYICDACNYERLQPGYVHLPFRKIRELVGAGEAVAVRLGSQPVLIATKGT